jgi:hypothetical protein
MECRLDRIIEVGDAPTALVLGQVVCYHVDDRLWSGADVDVAELHPLARLGGALYAELARPHEIPRPVLDPTSGRIAVDGDFTPRSATSRSSPPRSRRSP